ncbi:MAG: hypothetical protein MJZ34_11200 [Paludibacteraceae bacterium]|nr:hypothetical protein [Paludibacteraceae bacterium]
MIIDLPQSIINDIHHYEMLNRHKVKAFEITLDYMQIAEEIISYWKMDTETLMKFKITINF